MYVKKWVFTLGRKNGINSISIFITNTIVLGVRGTRVSKEKFCPHGTYSIRHMMTQTMTAVRKATQEKQVL